MVKGNFRPATLEDYLQWLRGYLRSRRNTPTHYRDFPFKRMNFLFAEGVLDLKGEAGSSARCVIMGEVASLTPKSKLGHNTLFLMNGFAVQSHGPAVVPIFSDREFLRIARV